MEEQFFPLTGAEAKAANITPQSQRTLSEINKNAIFVLRLKELRENAGYTQEQASKEIGITKSTLSSYEQGNSVPDGRVINAMARVYGTSPDFLLGFVEYPTQDMDLRQVCEYTGLSENTVYVLSKQKDITPLFISFIDAFISSGAWIEIVTDMITAISCADIAQREKCETNIHLVAALAQIKSKLSDSNHQYDGLPDLPPGTALISAKGAETLLVDEATKLFREFLQTFISETLGGDDNAE